MIKGPRTLSILLYLAGFTALIITALMNQSFGVSQGATEHGRQLLGTAAIVVDVAGLVIFGSVAGRLAAAGRRTLAGIVGAVVIACAGFSIASVMGFVASEKLSMASAREAQLKAITDTQKAKLAAEKERRDTQARLAEQHMKWTQNSVRKDDMSRREKRDALESIGKVITAVGQDGKETVGAESGPVIVIRPDGQAELISKLTGIQPETISLSMMAWLSVLLIIIKALSFPFAAYFWRTPEMAFAGIPVAPPVAPPPDPLPALAKQMALPPPRREPLDNKVLTIREEPNPEWRALLAQVDFPPLGARHKGPKRPKEKPTVSAARFVLWLAAYKETGDFPSDHLDKLYEEFCTTDHRDPCGTRVIKPELEAFGKKIARKWQGPEGTTWSIGLPSLDKLSDILQKRGVIPKDAAAPTPQKAEGKGRVVVPFADGSSEAVPPPAANENSGGKVRKPIGGMAILNRVMPEWQTHWARQQKIAWRAKAWMAHKKQKNRMSRARAA